MINLGYTNANLPGTCYSDRLQASLTDQELVILMEEIVDDQTVPVCIAQVDGIGWRAHGDTSRSLLAQLAQYRQSDLTAWVNRMVTKAKAELETT